MPETIFSVKTREGVKEFARNFVSCDEAEAGFVLPGDYVHDPQQMSEMIAMGLSMAGRPELTALTPINHWVAELSGFRPMRVRTCIAIFASFGMVPTLAEIRYALSGGKS